MKMRIVEQQERTPALIAELLKLWEGSVKATHLFLSEPEIQRIKRQVPQALREVPVLVTAEEDGFPAGFMGVADTMLEMLFVVPDRRGQGVGKRLLAYGVEHDGVREVAVNEQNPLARGFYEHMGFAVDRRTERDEQGNPYPLLYLKRDEM